MDAKMHPWTKIEESTGSWQSFWDEFCSRAARYLPAGGYDKADVEGLTDLGRANGAVSRDFELRPTRRARTANIVLESLFET